MNIRVDLTTPIRDGMEVVFRSPVDCSQVTGLKVYYLGESKEFAFADAHGNNVGDIDHLFAENVVVKVILDVAHGMAFVQNADTNAYLEGRFVDIIDKLCPSFEKTGYLVQCEPVEGYPLKITTADSDITAVVCGKNLYNAKDYPMTEGRLIRHAFGTFAESGAYSATEDFIPISHCTGENGGNTISIRNAPATTNGASTGAGIAFYDVSKKYISGTNKAQAIIPYGAIYMRFSINTDYVHEAQIEFGGTVTDYEEYSERIATGPVVEIPAFKGINNIYSYMYSPDNEMFTVTVTGKSDPVALIDKLMQAVFPAAISNEEE